MPNAAGASFQHEEHEAHKGYEPLAIFVFFVSFVFEDNVCGATYWPIGSLSPGFCLGPGVRRDERGLGWLLLRSQRGVAFLDQLLGRDLAPAAF
jgi:hypothetical protein